jgi:hypothetical protein
VHQRHAAALRVHAHVHAVQGSLQQRRHGRARRHAAPATDRRQCTGRQTATATTATAAATANATARGATATAQAAGCKAVMQAAHAAASPVGHPCQSHQSPDAAQRHARQSHVTGQWHEAAAQHTAAPTTPTPASTTAATTAASAAAHQQRRLATGMHDCGAQTTTQGERGREWGGAYPA